MAYRIEESPLGTYVLMLGNQLLMQATERADCERVKAALEDSTHAQRVLKATYYDRDTNQIKDGIQAR